MTATMRSKSGMLSFDTGAIWTGTRTLTGWYRRFRTMEAASNRLQKESKGYLDSLRGVLL